MRGLAQWFLLGSFLIWAHVNHAAAQVSDPAMLRVLAPGPTLQVRANLVESPGSLPPSTFEEPPAVALRRSQGWIRGAAPVAAISWGTVALWARYARPYSFEEGSCGGTLTPMVMATPLVISTVLTVLGVVRKRGLLREGASAYPLSRGRRTLRVLAIAFGTTAVLAGGMGVFAMDAMCFT